MWERGELAASFRTSAVIDMVRWRGDGEALAAIGLDRKLHIWDASFAKEAGGLPEKEAPENPNSPH